MKAGKKGRILQYCTEETISGYVNRRRMALLPAVRALMKHDIFPERFRRNAGLISPDIQIKLLDLPIFIAGCGGLGGEMAAHLAHLGAATLYLCDYDVYDESNLNRQRFCSMESLGTSKAVETANMLGKKIGWGKFRTIPAKLGQAELPECIDECAIIIDCLDSVQGKKMLENIARSKKIPWLHGAVLGHEGFACLSHEPGGLIENLYGANCAESGAGSVLSHVVAGTAALMCSLFLRWLEDPVFSSPLVHADFSIPAQENFQISSNEV